MVKKAIIEGKIKGMRRMEILDGLKMGAEDLHNFKGKVEDG